jgi:N-acyl-D-amino-acid deacylase
VIEELDVVVAGGTVVDGTGAPGFGADVGIAGDRIAAVGDLRDARAALRVDASGLVVAPGFVDAHVHSEVDLLRDPAHEASLRQGVTTHVVGQDGFGFAPASAAALEFSYAYLRPIYGDGPRVEPGGVAEYLAAYEGASAVNVATLVPNGNLRLELLGNSARAATDDELAELARLCEDAMREGAVGVSSGLDYTPSGYASTEELARLAAAAAAHGGVYVSHVRYPLGLLAGVAEAIEIGRRARCPVHVSHLRGDPEGGATSGDLLALLDAARGDGVDVTFDTYPYLYGCTFLAYLLPLWVREGEEDEVLARLGDPAVRARLADELAPSVDGWRRIALAGELAPERERLLGLDVPAAAAACGVEPVEFLCDLLLAERLDVMLLGVPPSDASADDDLHAMLRDPRHVFGSDGVYRGGRLHPRGYGACARFLGPVVRDGVLSLEEAVRHATSAPARRFGLAGRGVVAAGKAADLVVFDPGALADRSTLADCRAPASGVRDVFVNGVATLCGGDPTGATPGRGLRRAS